MTSWGRMFNLCIDVLNSKSRYSYKYVEKSIQNGQLEDLEAHRAGKTHRPVGAHRIPSRTRRIPYTLADDQILWDWLEPYEQRGDQVSGNLIYQHLEKEVSTPLPARRDRTNVFFFFQNPRHTFQSYRDRYLKHLRGKPRPGGPRREEDQPQQGTPAEDESAPERGSQRGDSQQVSAIRNAQSESIPRTPESSVWRNASSQVPNQPSPAEAGPSEATELVRQPARNNLKVIKRKRLSNEEPPAVPKFDTDNLAKRRRHATEADPYTPGQSPNVQTAQNQNSRGPVPEPQSKTASQYEDDANFAALNEMPFPVVPAVEESDSDQAGGGDEDIEGVEAWMEEHIRNGKKVEHVIKALDHTSMNAELADRVLALLSEGHEIPSDIPGVWTEQEDEIVLGSETREIEALEKKHGSEFYNERFKYLEERQKALDVVMGEED